MFLKDVKLEDYVEYGKKAEQHAIGTPNIHEFKVIERDFVDQTPKLIYLKIKMTGLKREILVETEQLNT